MNNHQKKTILFMGLPKAGKTSLIKVIFQKLSPYDTHILSQDNQLTVQREQNLPLYNLVIKDVPGCWVTDKFKTDAEFDLFKQCNVLIWTIDIKDELEHKASIEALLALLEKALNVNPALQLEVFITKVDKSNMKALDTLSISEREIIEKLNMDVGDNPVLRRRLDPKLISQHSLSIYEQSIQLCFSRVIQKLIPTKPFFDRILNIFAVKSKLANAYLFDLKNKVFIASDKPSYDWIDVCSDLIDIIIDLCITYNMNSPKDLKADENIQGNVRITNSKNESFQIYIKLVKNQLGLIFVIKEKNQEFNHLIEHNLNITKNSINRILIMLDKMRQIK